MCYCKPCNREYKKESEEKNKEKLSKRRSEWWAKKFSRSCKECKSPFVGKGLKREFCSTKCKILGSIDKKKNGCWLWNGELHPNGYAYTTNYEKSKKSHVHRISYEIFKGEIPKGMYVCHSCDVKNCCNPEHLWIGTAKENMQDAKDKGRLEHIKLTAVKGAENGSSKLNDEKVTEIIEKISRGIRCTVIAREYHVSSGVIYGIRDGKGWKHIPRGTK